MKRKFIVLILMSISFISGVLITNSVYSNYFSNNVLESSNVSKPADFSSVAMMLETGEGTQEYSVYTDTSWPDPSEYTFNSQLSKCEQGSTLEWDETNNQVLMTGNKSDKCYFYFDVYVEPSYTISEILATKKIETRSDFSVAFTEDTTGIVYTTTDNDGTTYYWAGDATDNYVYFAGFYWRIVRVNGDGTFRLIYDGSEQAYENGVSSEDRFVGTSKFNDVSSSNLYSYYVGYTYTTGQQRPDEKNGGSDSTIKTYLDGWYSDNLEGTDYEEYIYQEGKFCNDREVYNGKSWDEYDVTYAASGRLVTNKSPELTCSNDIDEYTLNIGLITADEVSYAGGVVGISNTDYYLYIIGYVYWTMTPYYAYDGTQSEVFGTIDVLSRHIEVNRSYYVKPVINLNSDIILKGDGTIDNPYQVVVS